MPAASTFSFALAAVVALAACRDAAPAASAPPPLTAPGPVVSRRDAGQVVDDEQARFDQDRRPDQVVLALAIGPGDRVADVGCGTGLLTVHLARAVGPTGKVVATDIDGAVLDLMRARLAAAGVDGAVEPRRVDPDEPGLAPDTFDAILLAEVDHYLGDAAAWLRTAARQLAPDGRLVLTNRVYHRAKALAAAEAAGLRLVSESSPTTSHFIAVFAPGP
ncbi:MAG: methyltransferase domain-containing protein [Kofleriaceae bacterium]